MNIYILGAPGTGRTQLARELLHHYQATADGGPAPVITELPNLDPQHDAGLVLLTGLDLDIPSPLQSEVDSVLRTRLHAQGIAYGVVYGRGAQRLRNALRLLEPEAEQKRSWNWVCEKCSDPECEHKLFTELLTGPPRSKAAGPAPG